MNQNQANNHVNNLENKEILTLDELVQYTGFSKGSIYQYVHRKKIAYTKPLGGKLFFIKKDIIDFLKSNRVASQDEIERRATQHSLSA